MNKLLAISLLLLSHIVALPVTAEPVATGWLGDTAIGGHDAVSYHSLGSDGLAVKGDKNNTVEWKGASWRFADVDQAALFAENPEQYAPAYNGHCANALSLGEGLVSTNGKVWMILDGQLYLFYAERGRQRWQSEDWPAFKAQADTAWAALNDN